MAPNLAIKSESWLDLSAIAVSRSQAAGRTAGADRSRPAQAAGARRLQRGHSVEPAASLVGPAASGRQAEHLLIRLRQQSYLLNRASSATLSSASQLSNSVDLDLPLVERACSPGSQEASESGRDSRQEAAPAAAATRRELSLGLRSFRRRFESRWRGSRGPTKLAQGPRLQANSSRSPAARPWSSLSSHLSSRLSHIGHSWKNFIYKYNQRLHEFEGPQESAAGQRFVSHNQPPPLPAQQQRQRQQDASVRLADMRQRLTRDWVAAHHHGRRHVAEQRASGAPEVAHQSWRRFSRASSVQPPGWPATCGLRGEGARHFEQEPEKEEEGKEQECAQRDPRRRGASEAPPSRGVPRPSSQRAPLKVGPATSSPKSHSASSSTTLVNHQVHQRGLEAGARPVNQTASKRLSLPVHFGAESTWHSLGPSSSSASSSSCSSLGAAEEMNSRQQQMRAKSQLGPTSKSATRQQLELPPVATSDYWSSAVTTSASSEFAPLNQQRQQQQQLNLMLAQNELFQQQQKDQRLLQSRMMMTPDQDYYLDVAAAQNLLQEPLGGRQHPQAVHLFSAQLQQHQLSTPDPDEYDDYAVPADESCCRLDRAQVELVQLIGEGQKGYVFLGKLQSKDGLSIQDVAIKTLKFETEQLIERLMNEAAMMKQLEHPHIIKFMGMCPETPALIAMELAQFGEVKHYLKLNRHLIRSSQLVLFAFQISTALSYLESKNYVHRDVAARNVLVCSHNCVKLADFGLSRNLQPSVMFGQPPAQQLMNHHRHQDHELLLLATSASPSAGRGPPVGANSTQSLYVAAPRVKLPVRWLAPESLVFRRFTSASDVWMFAVCAWELFQFGQLRPWAQLRNNQVLAAIEAGQRLNRPELCPERLYQLMLKSWSYAPVQRPKFREIKQCIWSIYLNERTREQLELERYERERQRMLALDRQQQQQVPILSGKHLKQQLLLAQDAQKLQQIPVAISSLAGALDYTPSSNYSSTLGTNTTATTTTTTTTDNEQSTSPCSSAFNSMGRRRAIASAGQVSARDSADSGARPQALLQAQLSRFDQRQTPTPAHKQVTASANNAGNFRSHVLQKQRSQGAIGMSSSDHLDSRQERRPQPTKATRMSGQMKPLDDEALECVRRGRLAANRQQRFESESESDDELEGLARGRAPGASVTNQLHQMHQLHQLHDQHQRVLSASPALTAGSRSRMVSMEPAYEGVFEQPQPQQQPRSQVAMLRAHFDLVPPDSRRTSPTNLTTSPALTCSNSPRPPSWRLSPAATPDANNNNKSRLAAGGNQHQEDKPANRPHDQLGQLLQALRITPMKARLKSSPELNVRVLEREPHPPQPPTVQAPEAANSRVATPNEPKPGDGQLSQLMLHQRLLGRIRPSPTSPGEPFGQAAAASSQKRPKSQVLQEEVALNLRPVGRSKSGANQRQLSRQDKSVDSVDHSLQILESLMSGPGAGAASSLPRRSHR